MHNVYTLYGPVGLYGSYDGPQLTSGLYLEKLLVAAEATARPRHGKRIPAQDASARMPTGAMPSCGEMKSCLLEDAALLSYSEIPSSSSVQH